MKILKTLLFTFSFISLLSMNANSQVPVKNYEKEWKKVEAFTEKQLPKSALIEVKKIYDLAKKEITDTASPSFDPVEYRRIFTEGLDTQFKFYAVISELTAHTLNQQIDDLRSKRFTATVLI